MIVKYCLLFCRKHIAKAISNFLLIMFINPHTANSQKHADKPNIIYILTDDLGYGDVQCFNQEGRIPTPNINRLAS